MKKQRKHINLSRITAFILSVAMLAGFCPQGVSLADIPITLPKVNAAENISNPRIVKDSSMDAGQRVTWDCVYFGSYPQSEVTSKDGSIYNTLKNATGWDENNDITIGRTKYRRLKGEDATYYSSNEEGQYNWNGSYKTYHYFKYELIKWRVLNRNGNDALLLADIALDDQEYNTNDEDVTWESSSMRSWLNGYGASVNQPKTDYSRKNFIDSAFTSTQMNAIKTTNVVNIMLITEQPVETIPRIKYSSSPNRKSIIQIRQKAMDLQKTTVHMMKQEEADAVPMHMRWVHGEIMIQSIQNTMEILIGGSARRAAIAVVRPN